jgi:hypothetical protein
MTRPAAATNRELLLPYFLPYAVYVAIASLPSAWLGHEWSYALRMAAAVAALAWAWHRYVPLTGPRSLAFSLVVGALTGLAGTVLWVKLLTPFAGGDAEPWSKVSFGLRLAAAGLVVPVFEELLMRGYVLRVALQWDRTRATVGTTDAIGEAFENQSIRSSPVRGPGGPSSSQPRRSPSGTLSPNGRLPSRTAC